MSLMAKVQEQMAGVPEHLGVEYVEVSLDRIVARMLVRPDMCTTINNIHGGMLMAFADTLGAMAAILNLPEGKWTTTVESKTNFLAPAPPGSTLIGEVTPLHRGRRTQVWETRISHETGKLVAKVTQTQLVL
jgi:1,4-dihydroxy-2-naphthoyl-CoA hydrolase